MGQRHPVEEADIRVTEAVADVRDTPLVRAAGWLSEAADQPPLRIAMAGWLAVGLARRDAKLVRAAVRMAAAHTLATAIKSAIKARIDRTRPDHALETRYRMEKGDTKRHELSSFPSGHTAGALAVTQALARDYPETKGAGLTLSTAVAAIQIPRCKHFVSDVAAGGAIGWAAEQVSTRALDWVEGQARARLSTGSPPPR
jgi:membrane-associated phospholipid phosphatase